MSEKKKRCKSYWLHLSQSELVIMDYDGNYPLDSFTWGSRDYPKICPTVFADVVQAQEELVAECREYC